MDNLHNGHKQRLRNKAKEDINTLNEHEVLELILNYTVVRSNMNPVAHKLINKFGCLANVLDADEKSLLEVDGVGEVSASFLTLLPKILNRYKHSKVNKTSKIETINDAQAYFLNIMDTLDKEEFYILCLDKGNRIITLLEAGQGGLDAIYLDIPKIIRQLILYDPARVILAHNHILSDAYPSKEDDLTTKNLVQKIENLGIEVSDHIIVSHDNTYSYRLSNRLSKL